MSKYYTTVCNSDDPQWLEERRTMLTASGVSKVLGINKYETRDQLITRYMTGDTIDVTPPMWWGTEMETANMRAFAQISGLPCKPCNVLLRSKATPLLGATLDGFVDPSQGLREPILNAVKRTWPTDLRRKVQLAQKKSPGMGVVEMKNSSSWTTKKTYNNGLTPPPMYEVQVQTQLYVTGLTWGLLVAKLGSADMVVYYIERDEERIEEILEATKQFWDDIDFCGGIDQEPARGCAVPSTAADHDGVSHPTTARDVGGTAEFAEDHDGNRDG